MNFKFKLSKRLARLKATLAVSVVLALACQSDLTDPKPPYSSPRPSIVAADLIPLTAASVVARGNDGDRKSTRLNSSHGSISYAVFCLKKTNRCQHATSRTEKTNATSQLGADD